MATTGELLRAWRERKGLSLEDAAFKIEILAKAAGIDRASKKIPRTHASLSRWETGKVDTKEMGLDLIARAYEVTREDLRRWPPAPDAPPTRTIEVPEADAETVEAFLKALKVR